MNFGQSIELLKQGNKVAREGWNGKGMFIYLVSGSNITVNRAPLNEVFNNGDVVEYRSHIDMKNADGSIVVWTASQSDILADDWVQV